MHQTRMLTRMSKMMLKSTMLCSLLCLLSLKSLVAMSSALTMLSLMVVFWGWTVFCQSLLVMLSLLNWFLRCQISDDL